MVSTIAIFVENVVEAGSSRAGLNLYGMPETHPVGCTSLCYLPLFLPEYQAQPPPYLPLFCLKPDVVAGPHAVAFLCLHCTKLIASPVVNLLPALRLLLQPVNNMPTEYE
jgi:hypothetical protein